MGDVTITNLLDTHVGQDQPTTNYFSGGSLYVRQWSGSIRVAYLYFGFPVPIGATITSAKLHLYAYAKPVTGTIQMYLRRLMQTLSLGKVNWNTRATSFYSGEVYSSKTGTYPDRTEYVFDITSLMDPVAGGQKWFGLQLGSDWTSTAWSPRFMSSNHPNPDLRPWVEFEWSDAPDAPTQLRPAAGRVISTPQPILRFDYTDVAGSTVLSQAQIQIDTNSLFSSPDYDSGVQAVDTPQWDLTGSAFTAVEGTTYYWRVKVADEANLWSDWSAAAPFVYKPLPTLTVDTPGVAPNNYVEEPTPPVFWTASDQEAYQLGFYRRVGDKDVLLWSRPRTVSATDGFTIPAGLITVKNATYRVDVRIYDSEDREAVPNGPAWTQVTRYFTYNFSALTTPVTALSAASNSPYPGITLEWDRATTPDSYSVIRDGVVIASGLDPDDDTFVSGIHNRWVDRFPVNRATHTYSVQAVAGGKASASNPEVSAMNYLRGTWLVAAADDGAQVLLVRNEDRTHELAEKTEVYEPLGSDRSVPVTQTLGGYQGHYKGELRSDVGIVETADELKAALFDLKANPGAIVYLFTTSMTIPVALAKIQIDPLPTAERAYRVEFDYYQQGSLPYAPRL